MEIHITKKDVLWGYIAQFFNIGAGILLLPVILKLLPADILGVWYIFLTISSLVQMIDFGFQPTFTLKCRLCIQWLRKTSGQRSGIKAKLIWIIQLPASQKHDFCNETFLRRYFAFGHFSPPDCR